MVARPGPVRSLDRAPPPARPDHWSVATVLLIAAAGIALVQLFDVSAGLWPGDTAYIGLAAVQAGLIGLVVLGARLERRPLRDFGFALPEHVGESASFAGLLLLIVLMTGVDPGFVLGFGKVLLPAPGPFGYLLLIAPLMALAQIGLFFGFVYRTLSRIAPLRTAIVGSAVLFALFSTDFPTLRYLGGTSLVEFVFQTTVVGFVLGLALGFYVYKARWSLLGPVAFLAGALATQELLPVAVRYPSWEVQFAAALVTDALLLVVIGLGLKEPRLQSLRYLGDRIGPRRRRFRDRDRTALFGRGTLATVTVAGVAVISIAYGLPTVLGTPQPILAIATGSMVPTFARGYLVVIHRVAPAAITVGTIIAFDATCLPHPTVHRVIRIVSTGPDWVYQTKGDHNLAQDPCTVPYGHVLGAVGLIVPYVGYLILDPLFAAAIAATAILVPIVWKGELRA